MAMQCSLQLNEFNNYASFGAINDLIKPQAVIASPCRGTAECDSNLLVLRPSNVCLNLEDLKCFEVVDRQFHHYGITFKNAIALQPSNPAYPPHSGSTVLMGAPKNGWMEINFLQPACKFCCHVTSSQQTILSAYDLHDNVLVRQSIPGPNLAGSDSPFSPNLQLKIEQPNICRITLYSFDGQLTIDDLSFGF